MEPRSGANGQWPMGSSMMLLVFFSFLRSSLLASMRMQAFSIKRRFFADPFFFLPCRMRHFWSARGRIAFISYWKLCAANQSNTIVIYMRMLIIRKTSRNPCSPTHYDPLFSGLLALGTLVVEAMTIDTTAPAKRHLQSSPWKPLISQN